MHSLSLAALLPLFSSLVKADCPGFPCDVIAEKYVGGQTCGVDPSSNTDMLILYAFCPCQNQLFEHQATVTKTDGSLASYTGSTFFPSSTDLAFVTASYNQPWTQLAISSTVKLRVTANGFGIDERFTYSPITSLTYTDTTQTATSVVTNTAFTTSTVEVTSTVIQPPQTATMPCTTGTLTSTGPASTSTVTSTITPAPVTKTKLPKIVYTTVHRSCLSLPARGSGHKRAEARQAQLEARQNGPQYEEAFCFPRDAPPPQTTITTATVMTTTTTSTTVTSTTVTSTTTTSTSLPTPATTTVCNNVAATVTVTPTVSSTVVTTAKGTTITKQKTLTLTKTIYPNIPPKLCNKTTKKPSMTVKPGCPKATAKKSP